MENNLIKSGSSSLVLGSNFYMTFKPIKPFKLLKITKLDHNNDEFKFLSDIRTIDNHENYYSIPDEANYLLKPGHRFYNYIKTLVNEEDALFMKGTLTCCYLDYAGNMELLETVNRIDRYHDFSLWNSYKTILEFTAFILKGLSYLHDKKICHLDIKPENIMVNTFKKTYKIIDFGFSSKEPFDDFMAHPRGTPGYYPCLIETEEPKPWLPKIEANDPLFFVNDHKLVYKIDSYCFGRVLYSLAYIYKTNRVYLCFNTEKKNRKKLQQVIHSLIESNVHRRLTISQCLKHYF